MGILSEAQSEFNNDKIIWCINYINKLRSTARVKVDELTASIFQVSKYRVCKKNKITDNLEY